MGDSTQAAMGVRFHACLCRRVRTLWRCSSMQCWHHEAWEHTSAYSIKGLGRCRAGRPCCGLNPCQPCTANNAGALAEFHLWVQVVCIAVTGPAVFCRELARNVNCALASTAFHVVEVKIMFLSVTEYYYWILLLLRSYEVFVCNCRCVVWLHHHQQWVIISKPFALVVFCRFCNSFYCTVLALTSGFKKPTFLKKTQPSGFFGFIGFGFYWVFRGFLGRLPKVDLIV